MKEKVLKALKELGFKLEEVEDFGYLFQYEGTHYLYAPNIMGEEFLNICIPGVCDLHEAKETFDLCHLANKLSYELNYVKAYVKEERLWIAYECNIEGCEKSLKDIVGNMISYLDFGINYTRDLLGNGYPDMEEANEKEDLQDTAPSEEIKGLPSPSAKEEGTQTKNDTEHHSLISNISKIWKRISN